MFVRGKSGMRMNGTFTVLNPAKVHLVAPILCPWANVCQRNFANFATLQRGWERTHFTKLSPRAFESNATENDRVMYKVMGIWTRTWLFWIIDSGALIIRTFYLSISLSLLLFSPSDSRNYCSWKTNVNEFTQSENTCMFSLYPSPHPTSTSNPWSVYVSKLRAGCTWTHYRWDSSFSAQNFSQRSESMGGDFRVWNQEWCVILAMVSEDGIEKKIDEINTVLHEHSSIFPHSSQWGERETLSQRESDEQERDALHQMKLITVIRYDGMCVCSTLYLVHENEAGKCYSRRVTASWETIRWARCMLE